MGPFLILSGFCLVNVISCYDSDSSPEINRVEYAPLYETIIYSDIADIIKDFENNMNSPMEAFINTEDSGSDEKVEDLLSEYQHYLEKAHKQRRNYLEKVKTKNKVPLLQRERYSKSKPGPAPRRDDSVGSLNYFSPDIMQFSQAQFKTPLDFLIPVNMMKPRFFNNFESVNPNIKPMRKSLFEKTDEKVLQLPPVFPSGNREPLLSSCYCETDTLPCECGCKQCLLPPLESTQRRYSDYEKLMASSTGKQTNDNLFRDSKSFSDNTLNIRIKVDVQFPTIQESNNELVKNTSNDKYFDHGNSISKESNINLPFPSFNFPVPLEMFGFKRVDQDSQPIHKITIHRKKKPKTNSNGKRHRKKVITFHNIKLEPHNSPPSNYDENVTSEYRPTVNNNNSQVISNNKSTNLTQTVVQVNNNVTTNKAAGLILYNNTKTDDSIYLMVNIRNNGENFTDEVRRSENSVEADYTKGFLNVSTEEPLIREKREVIKGNKSAIEIKKTESGVQISNLTTQEKSTMNISEKAIAEDPELLYWPDNIKGLSSVHSRNITSLILDTENKKVKLNVSTESIRHNRTRALEQAIFGKVDWDDVGTVAPVFMSFMGKYIRGVLTFCSESICHSMKCAEKVCHHRSCAPDERINNKGHCSGSNATDSVASMEAIMDLPSNIALEIVDILQDRMLGKLYGKATLCISTKCVSFVATKKTFLKSKCTSKDLNESGHCQNIKNVKNM